MNEALVLRLGEPRVSLENRPGLVAGQLQQRLQEEVLESARSTPPTPE